MRSHGSITVDVDPATGTSFLRSGLSEPPFSIRQCGGRVLIAASAAAPVGGDELSLDVSVQDGARADVGTVASTIVLPGPTGKPSHMTTRCSVGVDAHLEWSAEPTVSVKGSTHTLRTTVDLHASATCRVVEEVSLGRSGECSGSIRLVFRVVRDGTILLHHDETFGPDVAGAGSAVSCGAARHVLSAVLVGVDAGSARVHEDEGCRAAWLPIVHDAAVVLAVGPDRPSVVEASRVVSGQAPRPASRTSRR